MIDQLRISLNKPKSLYQRSLDAITSIPKKKLYWLGAIVVFVLVYLLWCRFSAKPQQVRDFQPAHTAAPVINMEKVPVAGPKQVFVFDKFKAGKKLDIPEAEAGNRSEQILDAVDVKPGPKASGSRVVTFINASTGQAHSVVKNIPQSWISFERGNELGAGYGIGRDGIVYAARYRRDILRVGSVYLLGEIEANQTSQRGAEAKAMGWAVYRW